MNLNSGGSRVTGSVRTLSPTHFMNFRVAVGPSSSKCAPISASTASAIDLSPRYCCVSILYGKGEISSATSHVDATPYNLTPAFWGRIFFFFEVGIFWTSWRANSLHWTFFFQIWTCKKTLFRPTENHSRYSIKTRRLSYLPSSLLSYNSFIQFMTLSHPEIHFICWTQQYQRRW